MDGLETRLREAKKLRRQSAANLAIGLSVGSLGAYGTWFGLQLPNLTNDFSIHSSPVFYAYTGAGLTLTSVALLGFAGKHIYEGLEYHRQSKKIKEEGGCSDNSL